MSENKTIVADLIMSLNFFIFFSFLITISNKQLNDAEHIELQLHLDEKNWNKKRRTSVILATSGAKWWRAAPANRRSRRLLRKSGLKRRSEVQWTIQLQIAPLSGVSVSTGSHLRPTFFAFNKTLIEKAHTQWLCATQMSKIWGFRWFQSNTVKNKRRGREKEWQSLECESDGQWA